MCQMNIDYGDLIWKNILHILGACSMLAKKGCKKRHYEVCLNIDQAFRKKFGAKACKIQYEKKVEAVVENDIMRIMWGYGKGNEKMDGN